MLTLEVAPVQESVELGHILVVEDEATIRETIVLALTEEGYEVTAVADGRQALELACGLQKSDAIEVIDYTFDLIVLDLMLPYVNGLDLCRLLRHQNNDVPILILSAKGTETDRVVGLEVGADDYLTKPFGMRELIARTRALLRRSQTAQSTKTPELTLEFGDIVLYPNECRVSVREQEVNLSPKEFKMLELFMRNPRRVWSRDQLIERVWEPDFMGDSKTVDVHIRWLREKIEADPSNPLYLKTVRGFGYRFG